MSADDLPAHAPEEQALEGTHQSVAAGKTPAMREGFLDFVQSEYHLVVRFVIFNGADEHQAMDAAQDAFVEAWDRLHRKPEQWAEIRNHRAWIRTVALRRYRRPPDRRREPPSLLTADPPGTSWEGPDPGELTAQTQWVLQALRSLPPDVAAVMAFHIDGFRPVDIAAELDMTDQKVRDVLKSGRRLLARVFEERGADEHRA
jgi:RNA polymerase sigma factor (sigma-70 family)